MSLFNYQRRQACEVRIGNTPMGGVFPIRLQSMANTSTLDTVASVEQCLRIIAAGAEYVRFTAQGVREAENLRCIRQGVCAAGHSTPLVADIHFNPKAADAAAMVVEKVRINPGNFVDPVKRFDTIHYTEDEYNAELDKIRQRLLPLLDICRHHDTALRIGVNHGSLSDRIMSRYGDTPQGMVASCMEFLRLCHAEEFDRVVISIKASNTLVMVQTVRLLVQAMDQEDMHYPLHLGVTEAGDGEDGRIKSAVGIGALLADGIGDTIRVSLSESPEAELPVARLLVDYIAQRVGHAPIVGEVASSYCYEAMQRRQTRTVANIGGAHVPVVVNFGSKDDIADYCVIGQTVQSNQGVTYPLFQAAGLCEADSDTIAFVMVDYASLTPECISQIKAHPHWILIATSKHQNPVGELRALFHRLMIAQCDAPAIIHIPYSESTEDALQIAMSADLGALLLDGFGNGVGVSGTLSEDSVQEVQWLFSILQAARLRTTKTEYISCPGCGRTLFDLQTTIARIKRVTSHLKGLKIGIMGCIVNGPGEMADADYGYVGAGRNKVSLYKGKLCIERNILEEDAVNRLVQLIKEGGDWYDVS